MAVPLSAGALEFMFLFGGAGRPVLARGARESSGDRPSVGPLQFPRAELDGPAQERSHLLVVRAVSVLEAGEDLASCGRDSGCVTAAHRHEVLGGVFDPGKRAFGELVRTRQHHPRLWGKRVCALGALPARSFHGYPSP